MPRVQLAKSPTSWDNNEGCPPNRPGALLQDRTRALRRALGREAPPELLDELQLWRARQAGKTRTSDLSFEHVARGSVRTLRAGAGARHSA